MRASITIPATPELEHLLATEASSFRHKRSSYTVEKRGDTLVIDIEAGDAVALRATVTSITRVLALYEKAHGPGEDSAAAGD